jgi:hypothetical protein
MRARRTLLSTLAVLAAATAARSQAAAKPTPPPLPAIEGVVRGPDRKPLEKALVLAIASDSLRRFSPDRPAPLSARTDAAGRFRLPLRAREPHIVRVESPGLAAATRKDVVAGTALAIDLTTGGTIAGTVRAGDTGQPVAGVRVVARQHDAISIPGMPDAGRVVTRTDAGGRFQLQGLANGRFSVAAGARGRGAAQRQSVRVGSSIDLLLFPAGSIFGTVLGADGRPVPGATVTAAVTSSSGFTEPADARGAYEILGLAPAAYDVIAHAPGLAPTVVAAVTIDRRTDAPVDLVLRPGARVVGRLVGDGDRAIAGRVALEDLDEHPVPQVLAAPFAVEAGVDGRFAIEGVPVGEHALGVSAPGLGRQRTAVSVRARDGQVDVGDVRLAVGFAIRGRVRSKTGPPIADAVVRTFFERTGDEVEGRSEPDGSFVLPGLEQGTYRVAAEAAGYASEEKTADTDGRPLELVLSPAGVITGRVVDDRGQPVDAFHVTADPGGDFTSDRQPVDVAESSSDDGRFRLADVPAGRYQLAVSAPQWISATVPDLAVAEGQVVDVGTVKLAPGGIVRGTVVDSSGGGVSGASIHASMRPQGGRHPGGPGEVTTDAAGAFELKGLSPGRAEIGAYHPSYAPADSVAVEVDPAKAVTDVRVVLPRGGRIEGSVRNRDGSGRAGLQVGAGPPPRARIVMTPSAFVSTMTAPDGTFVLDPVLAGQVTLTVSDGSGSVPTTRTVEVRDGETTTVEIVEREILLSGRVTRSGAPGAGLRLDARIEKAGPVMIGRGRAAAAAGPQRLTATTREDGSFEMVLDEPGSYSIRATVVDGNLHLPGRSIVVPDADAHAVELAYDGARVTGIVVDETTDAAVPNVIINANPRERGRGGWAHATTGADGRFSMELEPGDYSLAAHQPRGGYRPAAVNATVGTSGLADLHVVLSKGLAISGTVRAPDGQPAVGISVRAIPGSGRAFDGGRATTRADGSFEIGGLEEGLVTVMAHAHDGAFALQKGVQTGERASLSLRPGGRLAITVRATTGAPVPGASAIVSRVDGIQVGSLGVSGEWTDAQGRTELLAPAGTLEVYAVKNGNSRLNGSASVPLSPGGTAVVEVVLRQEGAPAP